MVILDLDKGDFVEKPQFTSTLPPNKANELQRSLQAALRNIGSSSFDKQIANSFVLFFCDTLEKYGDYIAKGAFDEKSFIASKDQETRTVSIRYKLNSSSKLNLKVRLRKSIKIW